MVVPSDQERPPRWKNHPAEEWVYLEFFASLVPNATTSSLAHALVCALSAHMYVCLLLCLLSFASLPHCCSLTELGPMTQIDLSASLLHLDNINERTNIIGDLTRHRVSWGSPLLAPLRVHMLSIDYQNYQIQKIKVINKTGHPAYWTRQKETLNCQPI
jgi:hypothetical protein